ncbi:MAG: SMI1/KNR4 family protein [Clostridia bacterium]|nr:SMI1/KNR4 family protein [Clostridia bacterium]
MNLLNNPSKISNSEISEAENRLGVKFSEEYKLFLLNTNGGIPEQDMLYDFYDEVTGNENTSVIRQFYALNDEDWQNDIVTIFNIMYQEQMIAKDMLPIADDPLGNIICLSLATYDYGTVYYLNHEFENAETGFLMQSKIADSFSDFINSLYTDTN